MGQEKLILGHHKVIYWTKQGHFLCYWKMILVYLGRWSYGRFLRWWQHLLQDEKGPNYPDMAGRYLMPHNYHLALHFWWNSYTMYKCDLLNLSIDFYVFQHIWGSRGAPFFILGHSVAIVFYIQIGILQLVLLIQICIYELV